jgi:hypothetical protein
LHNRAVVGDQRTDSSDQEAGGSVELEGVGGDFGVVGGPVVGGKGDAPEFGGGLEEFDSDFGFGFGGGSDVDHLDELLFEGFRVAAKNFLADGDSHRQGEQCAVGADVHSESVFRDVLTIWAAGNDKDGEAKKDTLGAAAVRSGDLVGGWVGQGGDGLGIVLEKKRERSIGGKYRCAQGKRDGPGGGSRTHTGSDPRQILSLLRLPVPPLRENL